MYQPSKLITRAAVGLGALLVSLSALAQTPEPVSSDTNVPAATVRKQAVEVAQGGPVRWHTPDATLQARLRTIRKEAGAGLQENLGNCRRLAASERRACITEARAIYSQEMAGAQARAASGN